MFSLLVRYDLNTSMNAPNERPSTSHINNPSLSINPLSRPTIFIIYPLSNVISERHKVCVHPNLGNETIGAGIPGGRAKGPGLNSGSSSFIG